MTSKFKTIYPRLSLITISAVYLLILVGGIVRSTGSGMGCPDWPKCFGQYVPPTDIAQLPANYKEVYSEKRHQKNVKMAKLVSFFGMDELAYKLVHDNKIKEEGDFNVLKTWIEYVNRLIGVVIGFLIFATFIASIGFYSSNISVFIASISAFVLVGFQGWLGSIVVSTNLLPGMITVHMLLALVIVALLIYGYYKSVEGVYESKALKMPLVVGLMRLSVLLFLLQVFFGTQVRESIDWIALEYANLDRSEWIGTLGISFYIHRSYSLIILGLNIYIVYLLSKPEVGDFAYKRFGHWLSGLIVLEIVTGALMAYLAIPAFLQPVHLFVASLIFGLQFYLLCLFSVKRIGSSTLKNSLA